MIETAQQVPSMARATGVTGPREMQQAMRATAMDTGEIAGVFQALRAGGAGFGGGEFTGQSKGGREFQKLMSAAVYSGLEKGRMPEFFEGVTTLMQKQMAVSAGDVQASEFGKVLSAFGRTGATGFQGARGAAVAARLQESFLKPGGGEWGQSLMLRAMGFGGGTSFFEAEKRREQGLTTDNLTRMLGQVRGEHGTGAAGALALRQMSGVSLTQAEELLRMPDAGLTPESLAKIEETVNSSKSLEEQSLDSMKESNGTLEHIAKRTDDFVKIGERVAPAVEALEDMQMELVQWVTDLFMELKFFVEKFLGFMSSESPREARAELRQALSDRENLSKEQFSGPGDIANKLVEQTKAEARASSAYGKAMGKTGLELAADKEARSALGKVLTGRGGSLLAGQEKSIQEAIKTQSRTQRLGKAQERALEDTVVDFMRAGKPLEGKDFVSAFSQRAKKYEETEKPFEFGPVRIDQTPGWWKERQRMKVTPDEVTRAKEEIARFRREGERKTEEKSVRAPTVDIAKSASETIDNINKGLKVEVVQRVTGASPARPKPISRKQAGKADRTPAGF
jgi:hypothetical protein